MTTRRHILLLKYCSTTVFTSELHTGLPSHLKPGMKFVRIVNSLLFFYPLNSYVFAQSWFFFPKAIQLVGGTAHFFFQGELGFLKLSKLKGLNSGTQIAKVMFLGSNEINIFRVGVGVSWVWVSGFFCVLLFCLGCFWHGPDNAT